jgi:N utilization substance protein B
MLPRRHIRIKVFQSLYAREQQNRDINFNIQEEFKNNLNGYVNIYYLIIDLLRVLYRTATEEIKIKKSNLMPSKEDLEPNQRFIKNFIFKKIKEQQETSINISSDAVNNIVKQIFKQIKKSTSYIKYMQKSSVTQSDEKQIIFHILKTYFIGNEKVHDFIETYSIYWNDDILIAYNMLMEKINNNYQINNVKIFRKKEDKLFGESLLLNTIKKEDEVSEIIYKLADNWDKERIALTDLILLRMALTELTCINNIPNKVTLDEYIEISKQYSTPKSKEFINGILDVFIKDNLTKHSTES